MARPMRSGIVCSGIIGYLFLSLAVLGCRGDSNNERVDGGVIKVQEMQEQAMMSCGFGSWIGSWNAKP